MDILTQTVLISLLTAHDLVIICTLQVILLQILSVHTPQTSLLSVTQKIGNFPSLSSLLLN